MRAPVASMFRKFWASPTTLLGLALGILGWLTLRAPRPQVANNALEFYGNRLVGLFTPAITLGNVILYAETNPSDGTRDHERQHTYQAELLGPAYIPLHVALEIAALAYSFCDRSRTYRGLNDRVHSPLNLLETGPGSATPRPWWW